MKIHLVKTASGKTIDGPRMIELNSWKDSRGFFMERFNKKTFQEMNLPIDYVQDNHSRSHPKVLRGMHFQVNPNQGKLVGVVQGAIWDVIVDLRKNSDTYRELFSVELTESHRLLWIPGGFAHGFCVLGKESADVIYKVDTLYDPSKERGFCWNDPQIAIPWPILNPIVSEKDQQLPFFSGDIL